MAIKYHEELVQGSDEWLQARCGLLTASEMKLILTPTLKVANNEKERSHLYELLAQRITQYVEPHYVSDDMVRGQVDEIEAVALYESNYEPVNRMGFITNDKWGFTLGYSPDALVGESGLIECKSRRQKYQVQTIIDGEMPTEYALQVQTGLLVSERKWCDFVSYSGGLPMLTIRVLPDFEMQRAIIKAATLFEERLVEAQKIYTTTSARGLRVIPTERKIVQEMFV
jgi:predicted phage-related endonuclease